MNNNASTGSQSDLTPTSQPAAQYLLVGMADRRYGVRLDTLQEVVRYNQLSVAPVPNSPAWLEGITSLRGNILSAVNLRTFLGLPHQIETKHMRTADFGGRGGARLLVVSVANPELTVGILVDEIEGVIFVQPEQIKMPAVQEALYNTYRFDPAMAYLEGFYFDLENKREVALLNLRRLVASPQMLRFELVRTI